MEGKKERKEMMGTASRGRGKGSRENEPKGGAYGEQQRGEKEEGG